MCGDEKTSFRDDNDNEEDAVSLTIKHNRHLLDGLLYTKFRVLYKTAELSCLDAWSRSLTDKNSIADKLLSLRDLRDLSGVTLVDNCVANVSTIGDIDRNYKPVRVKKCTTLEEKTLEIERYFTELWLTNADNALRIASESLGIIRENMRMYMQGKSVDQMYEWMKTNHTCVDEVDHTNYPALDFVIGVPLHYGVDKIISFTNDFVEKNLPPNTVFIKLMDTVSDVSKNNVDNLIDIMQKAQNFEGVELLRTSSCCLYNIEGKPIFPLYQCLAYLKCRVDLDKRPFIELINLCSLQYLNKPRYDSARNFKLIGYHRRHFLRWNYILIMDEHVNGTYSTPPIICNMCGHILRTTNIGRHLNRKDNCTKCSGNLHYNLELFKERSRLIHGTRKYDLSGITEEDINKGGLSWVKIYCNDCKKHFTTCIISHINSKVGCKTCTMGLWDEERILREGPIKHNNRYSYQYIKTFGIKIISSDTKIPVYCNTHKKIWWVTINNHLISSKGCPTCNHSKGELACLDYLGSNSFISGVESQYVIYQDPRGGDHNKKYDFVFVYQGRRFLIEFDGGQHFVFNNYFYRSMDDLIKRQNLDIEKTQMAIDEGYFLIRIDDRQLETNGIANKIIEGIYAAFQSSIKYYVSDLQKYTFITDKIPL